MTGASASVSALRAIPLSYNAADSDHSARDLVFALNPDWKASPGPVEFVRFKDGITNSLFKAIKRRPGYTEQDIDKEAVLLRAYGNGTDVLIDRDREAQSHLLLASKGLAPPLLARFNNGLLYRFIEGQPCSPEDLQRADVWPGIASLLGRWHADLPTQATTEASHDNEDKAYSQVLELIPDKPLPHLWSVMQKWINALPDKTKEERARNASLQSALVDTAKELGHTKGLANYDYVVSHCDLLSGNVIMGAKGDDGLVQVSFIDYEYTTPTPAAFDLANHFAEYIGFDCDMKQIPGRKRRRDFIKAYVASYKKSLASRANGTNGHAPNGVSHSDGDSNGSHAVNGTANGADDDDAQIDQLMREVDAFRGLPGLYWGVWALIQATISQIDFDYASYADIRLGEYRAWRDGDAGEVREQRWHADE